MIYEASGPALSLSRWTCFERLSPDRVRQELDRRFGVSGIEEKRNRESK